MSGICTVAVLKKWNVDNFKSRAFVICGNSTLKKLIMSDLDVKMLKISLRSVLTGMKHGASLRQLHTEFEERMGKPIPFRQLGFRNVVELIENLPDVACLDNCDGELRVFAVHNEHTEQLARFVASQKVGMDSKS